MSRWGREQSLVLCTGQSTTWAPLARFLGVREGPHLILLTSVREARGATWKLLHKDLWWDLGTSHLDRRIFRGILTAYFNYMKGYDKEGKLG